LLSRFLAQSGRSGSRRLCATRKATSNTRSTRFTNAHTVIWFGHNLPISMLVFEQTRRATAAEILNVSIRFHQRFEWKTRTDEWSLKDPVNEGIIDDEQRSRPKSAAPSGLRRSACVFASCRSGTPACSVFPFRITLHWITLRSSISGFDAKLQESGTMAEMIGIPDIAKRLGVDSGTVRRLIARENDAELNDKSRQGRSSIAFQGRCRSPHCQL
jgi:hypothetical protein